MTKRVKLAIAILATATSMNVNAQKKATVKTTKPKTEVKTATETKAAKPTKQETMDWIAGKMKENLAKPDRKKFKSYSNGILVFEGFFNDVSTHSYYSINLNNVTGMNNKYSDDFNVSGKQLLINKWTEAGQEKSKSFDNISISGSNYDDYEAYFNFTPDQALVERLKKAFATLIEYNSTKKDADEKF